MVGQSRARTMETMSIPPRSTVEILVRRHPIPKGDKHRAIFQFVPRHHVPLLSVDHQLVRVINKQIFLRISNESAEPIRIRANKSLGKFKRPSPFRFYDLPKELRDMILDFAVSDAHPGLKTLALKSEHGFVKEGGEGGDDSSISMVPKDAKFGSRYVGRSIAFPFMSKCDLTLASKSLADEYQGALWRFLLREESCWLQLRVHNFDFEVAHFFLARCSPQQLSQLRMPGKLVLQMSIRNRSIPESFQNKWRGSSEMWSASCKANKINPWVVFKKAFFLQRQDQQRLQDALAKACKRATKGSNCEQLVMIMDALDDICRLNRWTKTGYWISIHERSEGELGKEEFYFKSVEYGIDGQDSLESGTTTNVMDQVWDAE